MSDLLSLTSFLFTLIFYIPCDVSSVLLVISYLLVGPQIPTRNQTLFPDFCFCMSFDVSEGHVGAMLGYVGAILGYAGATLGHLVAMSGYVGHLSAICFRTTDFTFYFHSKMSAPCGHIGLCWGYVGSMLRLCWPMLGLCWGYAGLYWAMLG